MRVTITYDEVKASASRKGECTRCGGKTTRSRTFSHTVNPFNTIETDDGDRRSKAEFEVRQDVAREARDWAPSPHVFDHVNACPERKS